LKELVALHGNKGCIITIDGGLPQYGAEERMRRNMAIEKDVNRIRVLAEAKEEENWRFRSYLKGANLSSAALDRLVWRHL